MDIAELIKDMANAGVGQAVGDQQAVTDFAEACRRVDEDPREEQRISDINDLIDAEDAVYAQALAAVERGEHVAAEPLLRKSAEAGIGDAAWLLAGVLERRGRTGEALVWYRRAALDGDPRADEKIAGLLHARPEPARASEPDSGAGTGPDMTTSPGPLSRDTAFRVTHHAANPELLGVVGCLPPITSLIAPLVAGITWHYWADRFDFPAVEIPRLPTADEWALPSVSCRWPLDVAMLCCLADAFGRTAKPSPVLDSVLIFEAKRSQKLAFQTRKLVTLAGSRGYGKSFLAGMIARAAAGGCVPDAGGIRRRLARELTAADMMLPLASVPALDPGATVHDALEQLLRYGGRALPVTDEEDVIGVVTLADLAQSMRLAWGLPSIRRVEALMQPPLTVPADMPASTVIAAAANSQAGLLVVTGTGGAPVGYLTPEALLTRTTPNGQDSESNLVAKPALLLPGPLEAVTR